MTELNISQTQTSTHDASIGSHIIDSEITDSAQDQKETEWRNHDWSEQFGLYKNNRTIRNAIDALARWTIGKGYLVVDNFNRLILLNIKGNGKETFNSILKNLKKVMEIGGDAFAEIIKNKKGFLINLKPIDPGIVGIVQNRKGIIIHYNIYSKTNNKKKVGKIMPENMFHLSRNRIADEIHGTSLVDVLKWVVTAKEEAERDNRTMLRRNITPIRIWKLKSDKEAKITAFKEKVKAAKEDFEDIFIPMDTVETEVSGVAPNATLDPKQWIKDLDNQFYETAGVPKIIVGNSSEFTEAAGKIVYLSFEQTIEEGQLDIEEQVLMQLSIQINLEFPASLRQEILTGESKSETMQAATPEDTSLQPANVGGQT
jgi:hypothetical protein